MPASRFGQIGSVVGLLVALLAVATASAPPVAACSGGIAFDWAVAHAHGGILEAKAVSSQMREDYSSDLEITQPKVVQGDPRTGPRVHAVPGDPCEQTADAGEVIVVLFDMRGGPVALPWPLFYVIAGPDALDPGVVADAFGGPPATETASFDAEPSARTPLPLLAVLIAAAIGLVVAFRRTKRL